MTYTLAELADVSGYSARTIRYYISMGVLPSPTRGKNAEYTQEHVERLAAIKDLQVQGLSLQQVRDRLIGGPRVQVIPFEVWQEFEVAEDVHVKIRADTPPKRKQQVGLALGEFAKAVATTDEEEQ